MYFKYVHYIYLEKGSARGLKILTLKNNLLNK